MSTKTANTILKVFGVIHIVFGVLGIIMGFLALGAGRIALQSPDAVQIEGPINAGMGMFIVAVVTEIISGLLAVLLGIFCVRASKDHTKIRPAWILAIISLAMGIVTLVNILVRPGQGQSIVSGIASVLFSGLLLLAANTIRNDVNA